jgi:hypothetical protein
MTKGERLHLMQEMLDNGAERQTIFEKFQNEASNRDKIASEVAGLKDKTLCQLHEGKINVLGTMLLIHAFITGATAWLTAGQHGFHTPGALAMTLFVMLIPLGLAIGIYYCELFAYNLLLIIMGIGVLSAANSLDAMPLAGMIDLFWAGAIFGLGFYLRKLLYPHYGPVGLKRGEDDMPYFPVEDA